MGTITTSHSQEASQLNSALQRGSTGAIEGKEDIREMICICTLTQSHKKQSVITHGLLGITHSVNQVKKNKYPTLSPLPKNMTQSLLNLYFQSTWSPCVRAPVRILKRVRVTGQRQFSEETFLPRAWRVQNVVFLFWL